MRVLFLLPLVLTPGCEWSYSTYPDFFEHTDDTGDTDDTSATDPICEEPVSPPCIAEMVLDLSLHNDATSDGAVVNTVDSGVWTTTIDASAGGFQQAANNPWVYVRFTDSGAVRVDIDDVAALDSMEWHLSARRFILRLNGGTSGPSCVGGAPFLESTWDDLTAVPDEMTWYLDYFYTDECTIIYDSSGMPGSPQVVLAPWWYYAACVATTSVPFLIRLEDGRVIKLVVDEYYGSGQQDCNDSGVPGSSGANYTIRWMFMS
jgi:hypothetical protein